MDISNANQNYTITNNLSVLDITGANNNITIKSHINKLIVSGANNDIDGTDPNCLIDSIEVNGINNDVNLNSNCQNAKQSSTGIGNNISFGGSSKQNNIGNNYTQSNNNFAQFNSNMNYNMNNNMNMNSNMNINMNSNFNQNFGFAFNSNAQNFFGQNNFFQNPFNNNFAQNNFNNAQNNFNNAQNNFNNAQNNFNNAQNNVNVPNNNNVQNNNNAQNNNNNEQNNNNVQDNNNNTEQKKPDPKKNIFASTMPGEEDFSNLNEHDRKIRQLFLEMDEYQYKHIQKYESRKETECAICLEEFKGTDMIKAFYKCEHIFHKNCLRDWLKKQVVCPMCKHDLEEDIKTMK